MVLFAGRQLPMVLLLSSRYYLDMCVPVGGFVRRFKRGSDEVQQIHEAVEVFDCGCSRDHHVRDVGRKG